ncbi:MAG: hypothetical protein ABII13_00445 [Patescibacteria group bacterium]|nr:hypothetical protein [Patescibacteria group bacterium]MBU2509492.1 hypothetical protein [Patescibacteria group bacterium]
MGEIRSKMADAILNAVADGADILTYSTYKPSALMQYGLDNLRTLEIDRERRRMSAAVNRLKKNKYLKEKRIEQNRVFQLTSLGEQYLIKTNAPRPLLLIGGFKTIVSYDIPEKHKSTRQSFRRYLKNLEFKQLHLSVWVSDRDWGEHLAGEMKRRKIGDWVHVMQARIK